MCEQVLRKGFGGREVDDVLNMKEGTYTLSCWLRFHEVKEHCLFSEDV